MAVRGGYRKDVPGAGGDDVGGDDVDLVGGVGVAVGVEVAAVGVPALLAGALHLHAEEMSATLDGEVVGSIVAPGFGDAESEFGGALHEA